MKTSVILSAYNGENFILEQLESIRLQTRPVDEVLILDDCSTDRTPLIISSFIAKNELENWTFLINEQNKGFFKNFITGMYMTSGDILFFSDQDDIWRPNKVKRTIELFQQYPDILSLTSTFSRFNGNTILNAHVVHPQRKKNGIKKITLNDFCKFDSYLGMATAISRSLINMYDFQTCTIYTAHDRMVNFAALIKSGLYHVDEVLVNRRSYPESVSRILTDSNTSSRSAQIDFSLSQLKRHYTFLRKYSNSSPQQVRTIQSFIKFMTQRKEIFEYKDLLKWLSLFQYISLYNKPILYWKDGVSIIKSFLIK